jgi:BirA family transcriptional regulator, biotin operon repressor / biotin---[acetyl-CoA-carboxylase] ligase
MSLHIHLFDTLPSTNKTAYQLAINGAPHGDVVRSVVQTEGRGRLGKKWQSPSGKGLYFSVIVRPDLDRNDYPKLTMTAGVAIASAINRHCGKEVALKWPNDIFLSGKKCGGILCEASFVDDCRENWFAIIGVGLNVLTEPSDFPKDLHNVATSLLLETGVHFCMDDLLTLLCPAVFEHINILEQEGFSSILDRWKEYDFLAGKWLKWLTNSGDIVLGCSEGPDECGRLLVRDENGLLHQVLSGDISLAGK